MRLESLAFAIVFAVGCAHEAAPPSSGGIGSRSEATLDGAFDSVMRGAQPTARAGGFVVERVNDRTVRVMREAGLERVGGGISDASITSRVESAFSTDPDMQRLQVASDAGVVTLRGRLRSEGEAVRAIQNALDVNGVVAVNAELEYPPQNQANVRTYEK